VLLILFMLLSIPHEWLLRHREKIKEAIKGGVLSEFKGKGKLLSLSVLINRLKEYLCHDFITYPQINFIVKNKVRLKSLLHRK